MCLQKKEKLLHLCLFTLIFWLFEGCLGLYLLLSCWLYTFTEHTVTYVRPQFRTRGQVLESEDKREEPSLLLCCGAHVTMQCLSWGPQIFNPSASLTPFHCDLYNNISVCFIGFKVIHWQCFLVHFLETIPLIIRSRKSEIRIVWGKIWIWSPEKYTK